MKNLVKGIVLFASLVLIAAPARADQAKADTESEATMVVQQVGAAFMVHAAMTGLSLLAADQIGGRDGSELGLLMLALSPAAAATTACIVGATSPRYEARGKCWPTIGMTMATVPIVLTLAMWSGHTGESHGQDWHGPAVAALWLALPPILATTGWHLFKRPKAPALAAHPGRPVAFTPTTARAGVPAKGQMIFQLTSATF